MVAHCLKVAAVLQDVLQDTADKYLASPRPQDNAVGALLLHLYLTNLKEEPKQLAAKLEEICSLGENSFSEFQRDPVSASASFPLHGLLLTLVTCLSDVKCILAAVQSCSADGKNRDLICGILTRALCLARSSLFHSLFVMVPKEKQRTLGAMSANSADRVAPSFEDTNLAFTELIRDHEMAERIRFTPEQRQQVEERLASFCWHCIKNSCSLLDLVASISLKDNGISYSLDSRSLHDIVDALVAVMTGCRHRGAIESCCESLKSLCQVLSSCETTEISDIPFNFVKKALSSLTSRSKSSSVTRRSAGLPLLIRALLEGEARNVKRSMSWTVDHLSSVIRECAEQGDSSACTVDLPQAEALHVLCAVVGSASLTAAVMMHLGRILWFCFEGLASPFWLVRNAAHQLYGATAPRDLFLKKLDGSNVNNHDLYFVLDFLSRLKPPAIGQQGIKSLVPFQQCIRNHLCCRSWKLRLLAAKCVSSFCRRTKKEVVLLLGNVATLEGAHSHNSAHAHLHAVNRLLRNNTVLLPGSVAWRQKQTEWFLRRAAYLCPAEIVAVVQKGKECDVVMETALEFLIPQALRPDCGITPDLWCEVAVALVTYLNGASGTTVRALSLVVWSHCLKHCLQNPDCYSPEVERSAESWTSAITSAVSNREKLAATADIRRMHAARSLRVAGDSVFAWAACKCKPRKSKLLQSLFSATLALLQDEDPQVRSEAAGALPLRSAGPQSLPVQPNIAADNLFKKLVLAFEGDTAQLVKFLWRELCRSGPSALCEFQQLAKPTVASLFEQDESGVFMEPMVVSHMLHRGTQMALEGALQGSTDLMSFLLDEALRLADELMAVSQAIGEFTLLTDKPLGTNLEILARPKLHHAIAVLRARADLVEWACAHFIAEPRPGATAEMLRPGKEVGELSLLPNAAFQLSHVKACFVELWTRLTFE
ncbi:hypothetical protein MRX96_006381 [Rhipicephalus microplus]